MVRTAPRPTYSDDAAFIPPTDLCILQPDCQTKGCQPSFGVYLDSRGMMK